jgi:hypothetical protein
MLHTTEAPARDDVEAFCERARAALRAQEAPA